MNYYILCIIIVFISLGWFIKTITTNSKSTKISFKQLSTIVFAYGILLFGHIILEKKPFEYSHFKYNKPIKVTRIDYFEIEDKHYVTITAHNDNLHTYNHFDIIEKDPQEIYDGTEIYRAYLFNFFYKEKNYIACTDDKTVQNQKKGLLDTFGEWFWYN